MHIVQALQHGDDPVIEPGQIVVRVSLTPTGQDPHTTLDAFQQTHRQTIEHLQKHLAQDLPTIEGLQFTVASDSDPSSNSDTGEHPVLTMPISPSDRACTGPASAPVMARLDSKDVEILDALITAGIMSNRAEGIRWAPARIRERHTYTQLREHILKIDEIKAQFYEHFSCRTRAL